MLHALGAQGAPAAVDDHSVSGHVSPISRQRAEAVTDLSVTRASAKVAGREPEREAEAGGASPRGCATSWLKPVLCSKTVGQVFKREHLL